MRLVRLQWGLALLLAIGLVGFAPRLAHAQPVNISQKVGVCDPKFPSNCIKPNSDGSVNVNGGGGGSSAFTAIASGNLPVVAGANKPGAIDLFSSQSVLVKDGSGNPIDWTAPVPVYVSPQSASTAGVAIIPSTSAEACHVLKASAGNLYSVSGYIGAAGWLMVFNATSAPADGAVTPVAWAYAPAAGSWFINYGNLPAYFATGITVCASSTGPLTKTAYSTNNVFSGRVQ